MDAGLGTRVEVCNLRSGAYAVNVVDPARSGPCPACITLGADVVAAFGIALDPVDVFPLGHGFALAAPLQTWAA